VRKKHLRLPIAADASRFLADEVVPARTGARELPAQITHVHAL
jgi:hypothetical protein